MSLPLDTWNNVTVPILHLDITEYYLFILEANPTVLSGVSTRKYPGRTEY